MTGPESDTPDLSSIPTRVLIVDDDEAAGTATAGAADAR